MIAQCQDLEIGDEMLRIDIRKCDSGPPSLCAGVIDRSGGSSYCRDRDVFWLIRFI